MNQLERTFAVIQLIRPHNCILAGISVLVGVVLSGGNVDGEAISAIVVTFAAAAGGYAINDLVDVETDRIVKPWRPIPKGLSPKIALRTGLLIWSAGLGISLITSQLLLVFYLVWLVLLLSYSLWLKRAGMFGNMVIGLMGGSGVLLGGFLGTYPKATYLPFAIIGIFHFVRETMKSIADYRGDSRAGIGTSAVRLGIAKAKLLVILSGVLLIVLSLVPFIFGFLGVGYLIVVVFGVYPFVGLALSELQHANSEDQIYRSASRGALLLKIAMPVGLVAFVIGVY